MSALPPSQKGSRSLIEKPTMRSATEKSSVAANDCLSTDFASFPRFAPRRCATCTEKPVVAAEHSPQKSQSVVDMSPMDADALAPRLPTIAASMYCMATVEICAMMAGTLSRAVSLSC